MRISDGVQTCALPIFPGRPGRNPYGACHAYEEVREEGPGQGCQSCEEGRCEKGCQSQEGRQGKEGRQGQEGRRQEGGKGEKGEKTGREEGGQESREEGREESRQRSEEHTSELQSLMRNQ